MVQVFDFICYLYAIVHFCETNKYYYYLYFRLFVFLCLCMFGVPEHANTFILGEGGGVLV